jgi:hypothetical protein
MSNEQLQLFILPGNQPHLFRNQPNAKSAISERSSTEKTISQKIEQQSADYL